MSTKELKARLLALTERLNDSMDDPDVSHRLRLLEPGIRQLEQSVGGLESKVVAVAKHRENTPTTKRRGRAAGTQH